MAQQGHQYGLRQTDEYGNPIRQTDEFGGTNMGQQYGTTGAATGGGGYGGEQMKDGVHYGKTGMEPCMGGGAGGGGMGTGMQHKEHQGGQGMLHRTGSGSSSEDDGQGGRRKKGLKEKIKEKLPGGHEGQDDHPMHGTATTAYGQEGQAEEKKGIMDKIKEKLPGGHN